MKRLSLTSILFTVWALAAASLALFARLRRHADHVAAQASHFPAMPHSLLGSASILIPLSFPIFAIVFFAWKRFGRKPLREALGLLQFGVTVIPQLLAPIVVVISQLVAHGGPHISASNPMLDPIYVAQGVVLTSNIITVSWLLSLRSSSPTSW